MRRATCAVLLVALSAQAPLTPTKELEAKLEAMEQRRAPIESRRSQSFGLRVGAGIGYGLALAAVVWGIVALARQSKGPAPEPLSGVPPPQATSIVSPLWLFAAALLFAGVAVSVHVGSKTVSDRAEEEELALDEEERPVRRELAWDRDKPAE